MKSKHWSGLFILAITTPGVLLAIGCNNARTLVRSSDYELIKTALDLKELPDRFAITKAVHYKHALQGNSAASYMVELETSDWQELRNETEFQRIDDPYATGMNMIGASTHLRMGFGVEIAECPEILRYAKKMNRGTFFTVVCVDKDTSATMQILYIHMASPEEGLGSELR